MTSARASRGRWGQAPVIIPEKAAAVRQMLDDGKPLAEVAGVVDVSRSTLYRHLQELRAD